MILGTVQMGLPYGINNSTGKISLHDSLDILKYAFEQGIETLDTAEAYGTAHAVIGTFHKKYPNKKFQVITKLPNQSEEDVYQKIERYLNELMVDHLHAVLFHSYDSYANGMKNFEALRRLKSEGIIKNIGVSVYTNAEIEAVLSNEEVDIIQLPFNLFDNANLRGDILEKAKLSGRTIHTRSALLQGLFFKDVNAQNETVQHLKNELSVLAGITKKNRITTSELALSYCVRQPSIDNVLIGVDSIQQLSDNLLAAQYKILPELIETINDIHIKNIDLINPSLWN